MDFGHPGSGKKRRRHPVAVRRLGSKAGQAQPDFWRKATGGCQRTRLQLGMDERTRHTIPRSQQRDGLYTGPALLRNLWAGNTSQGRTLVINHATPIPLRHTTITFTPLLRVGLTSPIRAGPLLSLTDGPYPFDRAIFDVCHDHDTCCMTLDSTWSDGVIVLKADNYSFFFSLSFSAGTLEDECCYSFVFKFFNELRLSTFSFLPYFAHLSYSDLCA
jgi:hypothetical protein